MAGYTVARRQAVKVEYKGLVFESDFRFGLMVESRLLVELKCIERILLV